MVNVGGFFASLRLMTDEESFRNGVNLLGKFPATLKNVGAAAIAAGAGIVTMGTMTADSMVKLEAQAKAIGLSALKLDNWKNAAKLAHGDADSFVSSLESMNEAFRNLSVGKAKEDFMLATGMSGASFSGMMQMKTEDRIKTLWSALEGITDPNKQRALTEQLFGKNGLTMLETNRMMGLTMAQQYSRATEANQLTQADYDAALKGVMAQTSIGVSIESTFKNIGAKIEEAILPSLIGFDTWLKSNKSALQDFAKAIGDIVAIFSNLLRGDFSKFGEGLGTLMMGGDRTKALIDLIGKKEGGGAAALLGMAFNPELAELRKQLDATDKNLTPEQAAMAVWTKRIADKERTKFPALAKLGLSDQVFASLFEAEQSYYSGLKGPQNKEFTMDIWRAGATNKVIQLMGELKITGNALDNSQAAQLTTSIVKALSSPAVK